MPDASAGPPARWRHGTTSPSRAPTATSWRSPACPPNGYLTLTSDDAARAAEILGAPTVVPAHAEGWGHFTEGINEIVAAFTRHGLSDRLRVLAPGDTAAV